jgi:hypothetical protein
MQSYLLRGLGEGDLIFLLSIFLLASLLAGRRPSVLQLVQSSTECTPPHIFTKISKCAQGQPKKLNT